MNVNGTPHGTPERSAAPRRGDGSSGARAGAAGLVGSSSKESSFAKRLEKVADTNEAAERSSRNEPSAPREHSSRTSPEPETQSPNTGSVNEKPVERSQAEGAEEEQAKQELAATTPEASCRTEDDAIEDGLPVSGSDVPELKDSATAEEATEIICSSITMVSRELNIKVSEDIYHLDLDSPSEGVVDEIAEILYALKGIAGLMEGASKEGQPLQIRGREFGLEEISQTERLIRHEIFRIECAVNMLGVAGDIADKVAEKFGSPAPGNIPQAVDLSAKSMPQAHLDQVLSQGSEPDNEQVNVLLERLATVLRRQESKTGVQQTAPESVRRLFVQTQPAAPREVAPLESTIMRALLKLDGEPTIAENLKAAKQTETMDLPKNPTISFGKSLSVEMVQPEGGQDAVSLRSAAPMMDALSGVNGSRLASALQQVEESVLNQVSERFNTMLRTGTHELRVVLRPESLGEVHLKVQMDGDVVIARINVESQQVKQIVENNLQSLKDALAEHNLETGSFSVSVDSGDADPRQGEMAGGAQSEDIATTEADSAHDTDTAESSEESGTDTGRRYGNNTIEYYA